MAENLHTVFPACCTFTSLTKCGQKYVMMWRFTVRQYVDFSDFSLCVYVCSVSMSCHIKGDEFPQQEEPSLLLLYKPACNRLSNAWTAFKLSTSVSDNKTDDSGITTPSLTKADELVTPHSQMFQQSILISWSWNQILMDKSVDETVKLHRSYPISSSLQAEMCSCSLIPDNPSQRCYVIL